MQNPIIFVSGNPWDKGKDMLSRLLIEHVLLAYERPLLVEPYWETPVLSNAYANDIQLLPIPLSAENEAQAAMDRLPSLLEQPSDRYVIINLPGKGLHEIEHELYGQIVDRIDPLGLEVTMAYVLGPSEESHDDLESAWEVGLGSVADDCVAVPNGFYGSSREFFWWHSYLRRDGWLDMGEGERVMRKASTSVVRAMAACRGRLWSKDSQAAQTLPPRQFAGIRRWLDKQHPLAFRILYGPDYNRWDEGNPA